MLQGLHVDDTADIKEHYDFLVMIADEIDVVLFVFGEIVIACYGLAVSALARISGQDIDSRLGIGIDVCLIDPRKGRYSEVVLEIRIRQSDLLLCSIRRYSFLVIRRISAQLLLVSVEPLAGCDLKSFLFKGITYRYHIS